MARRVPTTRERRDPCWFISYISSSFFELLLISLLFVHALFSYMVHRFACYFKLPTPCMLCTSLYWMHPYIYKELICCAHKLEVSTLVYCHAHKRLADGNEMCERCLHSFADEVGDNLDDGLNANFLSRMPDGKDWIKAPKRCCSCCFVPLCKYATESDVSASWPKSSAQVASDDMVLEKLIYPSSTMDQVEVKSNLPVSSEITVEEVQAVTLSTKLDVPVNYDFASNGDAIKALSSADIGLRTSQIKNERFTALESTTGRESSRVPEDLKLRLTHISSPRWLDFPWSEMGANGYEASNNTKRFSIDKCESGTESLDGSSVSELEGESVLDRLKSQIEMDRKSMIILYKELEEERNASAIAANEAMAMINKLQEEKAMMQMDALQYLRMMEEQTEYDEEALQKLNDLLTDREKEILDLEAVVESYKQQFGNDPLTSNCEVREYTEYSPVSTPSLMRSKSCETGNTLTRNTVLDFEGEKVYISECLKRLEKKLILFSNSKDCELCAKHDGFPNKKSMFEDTSNVNGDDDKKLDQQSNDTKENSQKEISISKADSDVRASATPLVDAVQYSIKEGSKDIKERQFGMGGKKKDIYSLISEISQLNMRLEALEEDRNFLEHAVSSLRDGNDGIHFIKEIACHLRELRKIGMAHQEHVVV